MDINLVYIDDNPASSLEEYLYSFKKEGYNFTYNVIIFNSEDGYSDLIGNPVVKRANLIFVDSLLYENSSATSGKFRGEEMHLILKKHYPFLEIFVISRNGENQDLGIIAKHNSKSPQSAQGYYHETLEPLISSSLQKIRTYKNVSVVIDENESWEPVLKEKITNSLDGTGIYDELTKEDVDTLIESFKRIQEIINV